MSHSNDGTPSTELKKLERLIGTWQLSGDTQGTVTYEWMDGGFFMLQKVDMILFGRPVKAIEIIGHLQPFGEQPSTAIHSRAFGSNGHTFDYVYELEDDTLMIWGGQKGSPAFFKGKFTSDSNHNTGEWTYPGGGYTSNMTRKN